jgi:hypothetical protein
VTGSNENAAATAEYIPFQTSSVSDQRFVVDVVFSLVRVDPGDFSKTTWTGYVGTCTLSTMVSTADAGSFNRGFFNAFSPLSISNLVGSLAGSFFGSDDVSSERADAKLARMLLLMLDASTFVSIGVILLP